MRNRVFQIITITNYLAYRFIKEITYDHKYLGDVAEGCTCDFSITI